MSLRTGSTDELVHLVLKYELDGAFVAAPVENVNLDVTEIGTEELVLVSSEKFPSFDQLEDLRNLVLLVFRPGCSYRRKLEDWLHWEGLGVSLLPVSVVERAKIQYNLRIHKISDKFYKTPTLFIRRKDTYKTVAVSEFTRTSERMFNQAEPLYVKATNYVQKATCEL